MKHAVNAVVEEPTSRYSLSTKVLSIALAIAMVVAFSHFNAFAEFVQGGAKDGTFVQVNTTLENVVITDADTHVSYKQADVDALGYLPAAVDKVVTFTAAPYGSVGSSDAELTVVEASYNGVTLMANAAGQYSFSPVEGGALVVKAIPAAPAPAATPASDAGEAAVDPVADDELDALVIEQQGNTLNVVVDGSKVTHGNGALPLKWSNNGANAAVALWYEGDDANRTYSVALASSAGGNQKLGTLDADIKTISKNDGPARLHIATTGGQVLFDETIEKGGSFGKNGQTAEFIIVTLSPQNLGSFIQLVPGVGETVQFSALAGGFDLGNVPVDTIFDEIVEELADLVVVPASDERPYDGTPLTNGQFSVTFEGASYDSVDGVVTLPNGDTVSANVEGSITDAGQVANKISGSPVVNYASSGHAYKSVLTRTGTLTITAAPVTVTVVGNNDTKPFDGEQHEITGYTAKANSSLYDVSANVTFEGMAAAARTEAGTTNMELEESQFVNTNPNFDVTFDITDGYMKITPQAKLVTVKITGHSDAKPYDAQTHTVSGYDVEISDPGYTEADFAFSGNASASQKNVGTAYMGLNRDQFANTNESFSNVVFVVVDGYMKINPQSVTVEITGNNDTKPYDGTEHSVTGYAAAASSQAYDVEANVQFLGAASAARTNAGTTFMDLSEQQFKNLDPNFIVTFTVVEDGFMAITPLTAEVVVTIVGKHDSKMFDGVEHRALGYDVTAISHPLYNSTDFTFGGASLAKRTEVGTTNMNLRANQFDNINPNFTNVRFDVTDGWMEIVPQPVTVNIVGKKVAADYDGAEHVATGYVVTINSALYTEADFAFDGTKSVARTDAGTTNMNLAIEQFTNTNMNFNVTFTVEDGWVKVNPIDAAVVITGNHDSATYDGQPHTASGYTAQANTDLFDVSKDIAFTGDAAATRTNAGTTNMNLAAEQFANINPNFKTVTFSVTDGWMEIKSPETVVVEIVGASNTAVYNGKSHKVDGYTVARISNSLYTKADIQFTGVAHAERTQVGTTKMNLSADQFANTNDNFKVTFVVTDGFQTITPVTDLVTVTIYENGGEVMYDGKEHSVTGYDAQKTTISNPLYTVADFSEQATEAWTATGTTYGEYPVGIAAGDFTNISANFTNVQFDIKDAVLSISPYSLPVVVTVTENSGSFKYDAAEHTVYGYDTMLADIGMYEVTENVEAVATDGWTARGTLVGTYPVGIKAADFVNVNRNFTNVRFVVEDGSMAITDGAEGDPVEPGLVITKSHDEAIDGTLEANLGKTVSFTIEVKNIYNETKTVTVEEKPGFVLSETSFALAAGEEKTVTATHVVTEEEILAGVIDNTATVSFKGGKSWEGGDTIIPAPVAGHLTTVKTATSVPAYGNSYGLGETITYQIVVTNDGNVTYTNIEVVDEFTNDAWKIASLVPGESATFNTTHVVDEGDIMAGSVLNVATARGVCPDPSPEEPKDGVDEQIVDDPFATLIINKTASLAQGEIAKVGDVVTFTITAHNNGNISMHNVVVTDELVGKTWTVDTLKPNATETFTVDYTITQEDSNRGGVANVAVGTAETDDPQNPTPGGKDEIIVPVETPHPFLSVTKVANITSGAVAGTVITYTVVATNNGNTELTNVSVSDPLTGDGWTVARLAVGQRASFTTSYTVTEADMARGSVTNVATGAADNPSDEPTTITPGSETTIVVPPISAMTVEKSIVGAPANGMRYMAGEQIAYQVVVTNTGNVVLTNIQLLDSLVSLDPIERLAPGASQAITYTYTVTEQDLAVGMVRNTVTGVGEPSPESGTPTATSSSVVEVAVGAEVILDNQTPLAQACWVHWFMILGALITLVYSAALLIRRKTFAASVEALDKELTAPAAQAQE